MGPTGRRDIVPVRCQDQAAHLGDSRAPQDSLLAAGRESSRGSRIAGIGEEEPAGRRRGSSSAPGEWYSSRPEAASWTRTSWLKQTASQVPSRLIASIAGERVQFPAVSAARMETRSDSDRQASRRHRGRTGGEGSDRWAGEGCDRLAGGHVQPMTRSTVAWPAAGRRH